jgi:hypothetical protein
MQAKWERLLSQLPKAGSLEFWHDLNPDLSISGHPFRVSQPAPQPSGALLSEYRERMDEEAYFQTEPTLPEEMLTSMRRAIVSVKEAGLPAMFAFVYDIFYQGLTHFDAAFTSVLGQNYRLVPNFAVYYIEPSEQGKGFAPHRDAEYLNALDEQGMPTVITVWITVTEASPLNSCLYIVPKHRDTQYMDSVQDLTVTADAFAWEDVRALPTPPGVMSCWSQYLFHWGSRASRRAKDPRITYAVYLQSGQVAPVEEQTVAVPAALSFEQRLSMICRSLRHNNYATFASWERSEELLAFLDRHTL